MADLKYGRVFTQADVQKIIDFMSDENDDNKTPDVSDVVNDMDKRSIRFKWDKDEPIMVLRARDDTALATVRYYRDHTRPDAPDNHLDGVQKVFTAFMNFSVDHSDQLKHPD